MLSVHTFSHECMYDSLGHVNICLSYAVLFSGNLYVYQLGTQLSVHMGSQYKVKK